jgi:hypothetical protein
VEVEEACSAAFRCQCLRTPNVRAHRKTTTAATTQAVMKRLFGGTAVLGDEIELFKGDETVLAGGIGCELAAGVVLAKAGGLGGGGGLALLVFAPQFVQNF